MVPFAHTGAKYWRMCFNSIFTIYKHREWMIRNYALTFVAVFKLGRVRLDDNALTTPTFEGNPIKELFST